jgi:hypothetical protein
MRLNYRTRSPGDDTWTDVSEVVPFAFTDAHYRGQRRWFICLGCRRRCRVLYDGGTATRRRSTNRPSAERPRRLTGCGPGLARADRSRIHFRRSPQGCIGRPIDGSRHRTRSCRLGGQWASAHGIARGRTIKDGPAAVGLREGESVSRVTESRCAYLIAETLSHRRSKLRRLFLCDSESSAST